VRRRSRSYAIRFRPEAAARALDLATVLGRLQVDDEVLLAGLLVPVLAGNAGRGARADRGLRRCAVQARHPELRRVEDSGVPPGWNPAKPLKPSRPKPAQLLLSLAADVRSC